MVSPVLSVRSDAPEIPDGALFVTHCVGEEAMGRPFRFELELVSSRSDLDMGALLAHPGAVVIERVAQTADRRVGLVPYVYHGVFSEVEQIGQDLDRVRYRAVLRARLWELTYTRRSRIFPDRADNPFKTVPDLIVKLLTDIGMEEGEEFELRLDRTKAYPLHRYSVQYQETDFAFLHRWLEHEGIAYHYAYDSMAQRGKLVFTDDVTGYDPVADAPDGVAYDPTSTAIGAGPQRSEDEWATRPTIGALTAAHQRIPREVVLREYNYESPDDDGMEIRGLIDPSGVGFDYEYNNNYSTHAEGAFLFAVRRDEHRGRRMRLHGSSDHRGMEAGRIFHLVGHFNPHLDRRDYVLTRVWHEVEQTLAGGEGSQSSGSYRNRFEAQPADIPFRPPRETPWPTIPGVMSARVAGGARDYAELDEFGRYRVDVDYDLDQETIGKVRMAQPSVGDDAGFHFPLRRQTEVLLGHVNGDPSRPVILGAVNNNNDRNVINAAKDRLGTRSMLRSQGGSVIEMDDDAGRQGLLLANAGHTTVQRFGRRTGAAPEGSGAQMSADWQRRLAPLLERLAQMEADGGASGSRFEARDFTMDPPSVERAEAVKLAVIEPVANENYSFHYERWNDETDSWDDAVPWGAGEVSGAEAVTRSMDETGVYRISCLNGDGTQIGAKRSLIVNPDAITSDQHPDIQAFYAAVANEEVQRQSDDYNNFIGPWTATNKKLTEANIDQDFRDLYRKPGKTISGGKPTDTDNAKAKIAYGDDDLHLDDSFSKEGEFGYTAANGSVSAAKGPGWTLTPGLKEPASNAQPDPDATLTNFNASRGGSQSVTVGDTVCIWYGDKYFRHYGDMINWHSGDTYSFGPNGTSYSYYGGNSVTWNYGDCSSWSYSNSNKSVSYCDNSDSWSYCAGRSYSHSVTDRSESISATGGSASLTANGSSASLSVGGPAVDVSLKVLQLNASASLTMDVNWAITTVGVKVGKEWSFNPLGDTSCKTKKQKIAAQNDIKQALSTELALLSSMKISLDKTDHALKMTKGALHILKNQAHLTSNAMSAIKSKIAEIHM